MDNLLNNSIALTFLLAGNSTFTLVSKKTQARFTYKIKAPKKVQTQDTLFVSLLTRPDNEKGYEYIGFIRNNIFFHGKKRTRITETAPSILALQWSLIALKTNTANNLEVWHCGKCGCCGRKLTVPSSIEIGLGPECQKRFL